MRLRIADVLRAGAEAFFTARRVPTVVHKAVRAILACRTRELGGHWGVCPGGHLSVWYNACRHRSCPRCSFTRVTRWLARQAKVLLGCAHHHVIFTVPHELNPLWQLNPVVMGNLLFASARAALFGLAADPKYLGALPGVIMALHTWGQQLSLHPHIHCVVTAGGVDGGGVWRDCPRFRFLPAGPLKRLFRGKLLDGLRQSARRGDLRLPKGWSVADIDRLAWRLTQKRWNVHIRERYRDPSAVLSYLGRYLHGGPFGERRLVGMSNSQVEFRYKDYRRRRKATMSLPVAEFIRRYLQHVPPAGFHMVRGFGLYRRGSQNNHLRDTLAERMPFVSKPHARLSAEPDATVGVSAGERACVVCGEPIRRIGTMLPLIRVRSGPKACVA